MFNVRLSLVSALPVMWQDATSSIVLAMPYHGNKIIIAGVDETFSEMPLDVSGFADGVYDYFTKMIGGSPSPYAGAAWTPGGYVVIPNGTAITDGTGSNPWDNLSAAFDGVTSQGYLTGALTNGASNLGLANYLGQDWGALHTVAKAVVYAPNDDWLRGDVTKSLPVELDGWRNATEGWVNLYDGFLDASIAPPAPPYVLNPRAKIPFSKMRFGMAGNNVQRVKVAELQFYEWKDAVRSTPLVPDTYGVLTDSVDGGTWLGTFTVASGVVTRHFSEGPSRRCDIWNAHNQKSIILKAASYPGGIRYVPSKVMDFWGPSYDDPTNAVTFVTGEPQAVRMDLFVTRGVHASNELFYGTSATDIVYTPTAGYAACNNGQYQCAIGLNRTDGPDSKVNGITFEIGDDIADIVNSYGSGMPFNTDPLIGINTGYALENHGSRDNLGPTQFNTLAWTRSTEFGLSVSLMG